jgi:hypothetical protein
MANMAEWQIWQNGKYGRMARDGRMSDGRMMGDIIERLQRDGRKTETAERNERMGRTER